MRPMLFIVLFSVLLVPAVSYCPIVPPSEVPRFIRGPQIYNMTPTIPPPQQPAPNTPPQQPHSAQ